MSIFTEQKFQDLMESIAASTPAPGGGTAAALAGVMAASLVEMVANLTIGRKKYQDVQAEMDSLAREVRELRGQLSELAAEDARAYEEVMDAYKYPKTTDEEKALRDSAIEKALHRAALVPLRTAKSALCVLEHADVAAEKGNRNALTDAGVAALLSSAAVEGALINVRVNLTALANRPIWAAEMEQECQVIATRQNALAEAMRKRVTQ